MHAPTPTQFGSSSRNVHSLDAEDLARGCGFALARYVRHGRIPAGLHERAQDDDHLRSLAQARVRREQRLVVIVRREEELHGRRFPAW